MTTPATRSREKPRDRVFDSAGVAIRFLEAGRGDPVLLLHSFTGSVERDFVRPGLFARVALEFRAFGVDLRGHGRSGKPHDPRQYGREMALDIVRLLDHLHLESAHVVGYSLGAHVVAQLVAFAPARCRTATLGGAPGRLHWSDDDDRRVDVEAAEIERGVLRAQILRLWPRALPPPSEDEIRARSVAYLRGNDRQALAAMRRANRDQRVRDADLAASGVPILGLVGSNDGYLGEFRELALHVPQLELVVLEDTAHGEAARHPRFADALLDFLARHARAS